VYCIGAEASLGWYRTGYEVQAMKLSMLNLSHIGQMMLLSTLITPANQHQKDLLAGVLKVGSSDIGPVWNRLTWLTG
jgi:hypothetical protein